jgi:cyclohexa-1,5-dienecarbonyl-CoA hydratase
MPPPTATSAVAVARSGRSAELTLDRPPLNVLDLEALGALDRALAELEGDDALQVLVVRGAGGRAFSAGVAVEDHTPERIGPMLETFHRALRRLAGLPAVTIAAVSGHCLGGGLELAMSCDLVVAAESAGFGQPEIDLGCFPPWAAAFYPPRIGARATLELLVTGRRLDAAAACRAGLAGEVVADAELDRRVGELVEAVTAKSAAVTRLIKRAVAAAAAGGGFDAALAESERLYLEELAATDDMREGVAAFLAKRPPRWRHR